MHHTTLGRTGLQVSVAGLGTGGFSRLGLKTGLTEDQSARLIHEAVALAVNVIDTAPSCGTEGVVGQGVEADPGALSGRTVASHVTGVAPDASV
jgi:aryl-alcohol dehydrogenase-like predicted oxidoreductase